MMKGRHPYVPPHCVVLNVLATFVSSVVKILMDPNVGCTTIFVKVASPKVALTIEMIDSVVSLGIFFILTSGFKGVFLDWLLSFSISDGVGQTGANG